MTTLQIFDPPMCCSTGVCGPNVDPVLPRFAADLHWLVGQGVRVERYNLSQQPEAFVAQEVVTKALTSEGNNCLPLVLVDGAVASAGAYPSRDDLIRMVGLAPQAPPELKLPVVRSCCCGPKTPGKK